MKLLPRGAIERAAEWLRPHVLDASDGILTTAGIVEGLAGAGVRSSVLLFAGLTGLVAGTLAMGGSSYSVAAAERDRQIAQLAAEGRQLATAPEAELDELTQLYMLRSLARDLARRVAIALTAHDALRAHAEVEHGIDPASVTDPRREATAAGVAFAAGATLPLLAVLVLPAPLRVPLTFAIVVLALALTGWVSARISDVYPVRPILRTAGIGLLTMTITYVAGRVFHP